MVRIEGLTLKAALFFFFSFFHGISACFGGYLEVIEST